ncbi:MAG: hypothetical protein ACLQUT_09440 [Thermoleophilia bacterium]
MTIGCELVTEMLDAGLLVHRNGSRIHLTSPLGNPLPPALRERIGQHRDDVLAWLAYGEAANDLVTATMGRVIDSYPIGARLDGPAWQEVDAVVTAAYHSGDLETLRCALAVYERFALDYFAACTNHSREARS